MCLVLDTFEVAEQTIPIPDKAGYPKDCWAFWDGWFHTFPAFSKSCPRMATSFSLVSWRSSLSNSRASSGSWACWSRTLDPASSIRSIAYNSTPIRTYLWYRQISSLQLLDGVCFRMNTLRCFVKQDEHHESYSNEEQIYAIIVSLPFDCRPSFRFLLPNKLLCDFLAITGSEGNNCNIVGKSKLWTLFDGQSTLSGKKRSEMYWDENLAADWRASSV